MSTCTRCCLHKSLTILNLVTIVLGIGVIVYSLWLQKKWDTGVAGLSTASSLSKPWFIYACFGGGIAVCLSSLFGCTIANCITSSVLCIYIITVCSILFLETAVIILLYFNYDWVKEIGQYIDDNQFKRFVIFHIKMCQIIAILILVPQISVLGLSVTLWAVGSEGMTQNSSSEIPDFSRSFLVGNGSGMLQNSRQICTTCESIRTGSPRQSLLSYVKGVFRTQILRRPFVS